MQRNEREVLSLKKIIEELDLDISPSQDPDILKHLTKLKEILNACIKSEDFEKIKLAIVYLSMIPVKSSGFFSSSHPLDKNVEIQDVADIKTQIEKEKYPSHTVKEPKILRYFYDALKEYYKSYVPSDLWTYSYPKQGGEVNNDAVKFWQANLTEPRDEKMTAEEQITEKEALKSARDFYDSNPITIEDQSGKNFEEKQKTPEVIKTEFDKMIDTMLVKTSYTDEQKHAIRLWFYKNGGQEMKHILTMLFSESHFTKGSKQNESELWQIGTGMADESNWFADSEGIYFNYNYRANRLQRGTGEFMSMDSAKKMAELFTINDPNFETKIKKTKEDDASPLMRFRVKVKLDVSNMGNEIIVKPSVTDCSIAGFTSLIESPRFKMELEEADKFITELEQEKIKLETDNKRLSR